MKKTLIFALVSIGFSTMAGQIVLMRQLLVIFYGNELSLGITLACWLFWVSLGSWLSARCIVTRVRQKIFILAFGETALSVFMPLSLLAVRAIPFWLNYLPGEVMGVLPMSLATFLLLAPLCILAGFLFVLGCEVYRIKAETAMPSRNGSAEQGIPLSARVSSIGYVYILEAVGASLGGLITSLLLIRFFAPLYILFLIGCLNLLAALILLWSKEISGIFTRLEKTHPVRNNISKPFRGRPFRGRGFLTGLSGILLAAFLFFILSGKLSSLRSFSLSLQWKKFNLLDSRNSVYGNIAVVKKKNIFSIFTNGLYNFSVPDRFTSEKDAHFPLLEHPSPRAVLLIGGGSSGQLREVLKHPVERVDYVELDPLVIALARKYLPLSDALDDPRVRVISRMDGRLFIKRTEQKYDLVIINLPSPRTAQLNRFYTLEFYSELKNVLKEEGILSFTMHSNPNYISQEQVELYLTLKKTLEKVFPQVVITPGETNHFLAARQKGTLSLDWRILMKRMRERNIEAKYMREYYLYSELSQERIDFFQKRLQQSRINAINRDLKPIAYYYDLVLWNSYFKYNLKRLFKAISPKGIYTAAVFIYFLLFVPLLIRGLRRRAAGWAVLICVATTGFAEITFQIVTLLAFQVIYGYVYYKLGIILTSYMLGLILGGWWITKAIEEDRFAAGRGVSSAGFRHRGDYRLFIKTQTAISIYPLILPLLFWAFLNLKGNFSFWLGSNLVFLFLPLIPGLIGGFQFPLANKLYLHAESRGVARSAGLTYGIDLLGSSLGAVLVTVFLIPIIGIAMVCVLTAGLNLAGLILLLYLLRRE